MDDLRPLSDITETLQRLAKSKSGDSLFTGSEFMNEYGAGLDQEGRETIAFAGGDLQNAYSKLWNVYSRAKNANDNARNEYKVNGRAEQSLNTDALAQDLQFAIENLTKAAGRLETYDISIAPEVRTLIQHVEAHKERIEQTGMVILN